jgi:hypothetical protein
VGARNPDSISGASAVCVDQAAEQIPLENFPRLHHDRSIVSVLAAASTFDPDRTLGDSHELVAGLAALFTGQIVRSLIDCGRMARLHAQAARLGEIGALRGRVGPTGGPGRKPGTGAVAQWSLWASYRVRRARGPRWIWWFRKMGQASGSASESPSVLTRLARGRAEGRVHVATATRPDACRLGIGAIPAAWGPAPAEASASDTSHSPGGAASGRRHTRRARCVTWATGGQKVECRHGGDTAGLAPATVPSPGMAGRPAGHPGNGAFRGP